MVRPKSGSRGGAEFVTDETLLWTNLCFGVASVISKPATCQVPIAGEHFLCVNGSQASKVENFYLAHALDIRFDFLLRRHYKLCLSQC